MKDELGLNHFEGHHWLSFHEQLRDKKVATETPPTIRRNLQAALIRLCGCCPWCLISLPRALPSHGRIPVKKAHGHENTRSRH